MDVEDRIKDKAREIRRLRGWSQEVTAQKLGWSKSKYSRFEGSGRVLVNDLYEVCELFGVGLSHMAGSTTAVQDEAIELLEGIIKKKEHLQDELVRLLEIIDPKR